MHIPDGFVDARTAVATGLIAGAGVGVALREVRRSLPPSRMPLLGVSAAFLFAAQMLNFPVAAGTSGHLVGGVLAVALLGPAAAVIVMTTVVVVQCLLFGDGGVTALGANVLNMAVVAPLVGYLPYRMLGRLLPGERGRNLDRRGRLALDRRGIDPLRGGVGVLGNGFMECGLPRDGRNAHADRSW